MGPLPRARVLSGDVSFRTPSLRSGHESLPSLGHPRAGRSRREVTSVVRLATPGERLRSPLYSCATRSEPVAHGAVGVHLGSCLSSKAAVKTWPPRPVLPSRERRRFPNSRLSRGARRGRPAVRPAATPSSPATARQARGRAGSRSIRGHGEPRAPSHLEADREEGGRGGAGPRKPISNQTQLPDVVRSTPQRSAV